MRRALLPVLRLALALLALGCSSSSTKVPAGDGAVTQTDATVKPKDDSGGTPAADAATVKVEAYRYTGQLSEWQATAPVPSKSDNNIGFGFSAGEFLFAGEPHTAATHGLYRTRPNADGTLPPWTAIDLSFPTCATDESPDYRGLTFSRSAGYLLGICRGTDQTPGPLWGHSTFYTAKFQSDGTFGPWNKAGALKPGGPGDVLFVGKFLLVAPPVSFVTTPSIKLVPPQPFLLAAELLADGTLGPWVTAMDEAPSYYVASPGDLHKGRWATNGADVYLINPGYTRPAQCGGSSTDCVADSRQVYVATMDATGKLGAFSPSIQVPYNGLEYSTLVAHGFLYTFGYITPNPDCCRVGTPSFFQNIYYAPLGQYGILKDWRGAPMLPGGAHPNLPFVALGGYMYFIGTPKYPGATYYAKFLTELDPKNTGEVPVTPPPASGPGSDCKGSSVAWCASYQKCVNLTCPYWCMGGGIMYCFKGPPSADDVRSTCTEPTAHYLCH